MIVLKYKKVNIGSTLNEEEGRTSDSFNNSSNNSKNNHRWMTSNGRLVDVDSVDEVVEAALQDMGSKYPSVEKILSHKDIIYTDDPRIRTMATDGVSIFINPAFAENLINSKVGPIALEFVLMHEAFHILFDHCNQHMNKLDTFSDSEKVNHAQDYEINYVIENYLIEGFDDTPFKGITEEIGGLYNEDFGKKGLTWEEIYNLIPNFNREKDIEKTSDEWKRGFKDGFDDVMSTLRKQNLVEQHEIRC